MGGLVDTLQPACKELMLPYAGCVKLLSDDSDRIMSLDTVFLLLGCFMLALVCFRFLSKSNGVQTTGLIDLMQNAPGLIERSLPSSSMRAMRPGAQARSGFLLITCHLFLCTPASNLAKAIVSLEVSRH